MIQWMDRVYRRYNQALLLKMREETKAIRESVNRLEKMQKERELE